MTSVYVDGIGMTEFEKKSAFDLKTLLVKAGREALLSSKHPEPQAIFLGAMNPEEFTGTGNIATVAADALGLTGIPSIRVETASSSGAAVFSVAYTAVASGIFKTVLVIAGEKMTDVRVKRITSILAEVIEEKERNSGASMPAFAAMITRAYMRRYGITREEMESALSNVAIKNHFNGSLNPYSHFKNRITLEHYLKSRFIAEPLRLHDCSPISDGAAALVLTSEKRDVRVAGVGQGTDTHSVRHRDLLTSFVATRIAAKQAYEMAGIGPNDINFAEVHDAFTSFEIINSEDLGFFEEGAGWKAVEDRVTGIDGKFPINPSGGLKSRGHPVGATGLVQVVESVWQMREEVEPERQVGKVDRALTHSIGGVGNNNFVIILEKEKRGIKLFKRNDRYALPIHVSRNTGEDIDFDGEVGELETFTVLHVTPEEFSSPLVLGFVKFDEGMRVLARAANLDEYNLGEAVKVERVGDSYIFRKKSIKEKFKSIFRFISKIPDLFRRESSN